VGDPGWQFGCFDFGSICGALGNRSSAGCVCPWGMDFGARKKSGFLVLEP